MSASRYIDVNEPLQISPPSSKGTKRALLIGINYEGQQNCLSGCHNDVKNIQQYLERVHDFQESDMLVLMDDGMHHAPTRKNILEAFDRLVTYSRPGDVVFVHYSGHGSQIPVNGKSIGIIFGKVELRSFRFGSQHVLVLNKGGNEDTIIPVDFVVNGQIAASDILNKLVKPMRAGVNAGVLMDCCHSGTVLDLPYMFQAGDEAMVKNKGFDIERCIGTVESVVCCSCLQLWARIY